MNGLNIVYQKIQFFAFFVEIGKNHVFCIYALLFFFFFEKQFIFTSYTISKVPAPVPFEAPGWVS
jgi:hypothetical protein